MGRTQRQIGVWRPVLAALLLAGIGVNAPAWAQGGGQGQEQEEETETPEGQEGQWQAPNQGPPMGNNPNEGAPTDGTPPEDTPQPPTGPQTPTTPQPPTGGTIPTPPTGGTPPAPPTGGTPATPPATGGQAGLDSTGILNAHNELRARHGVPAMQWSDALQQESQTWANRCIFEHSTTNNGENLSWWTGNNTQSSRVHDWYSEIKDYDFATGQSTNGNAVGHFTQIVWRTSSRVGCGIANCNGGKTLVCQYSPAGNVQGLYLTNVPPAR